MYEHEAFDIEVRDYAVLPDMDTQEDCYNLLSSYFYRQDIPTLDECWQILREARIDERVREHCCVVAVISLELAEWLNKAGAGLDEELIMAGALLHDIARFEPDHAQAGARLLLSKGYPLVAAVVGAHMDIEVSEDRPLTEAEVVYLADKMVKGKSLVSIHERFAQTLRKYKGDLQACAAVVKRLQQAERIMEKVNGKLGCTIETVLEPYFRLEKRVRCMIHSPKIPVGNALEDRKDLSGASR